MQGATLEEIDALATANGMEKAPISTACGATPDNPGWRYYNPGDSDVNLIWEPGDPANARSKVERGPYIKYQVSKQAGGGAYRVAGAGNPYPEDSFSGDAPEVIAQWGGWTGGIEDPGTIGGGDEVGAP